MFDCLFVIVASTPSFDAGQAARLSDNLVNSCLQQNEIKNEKNQKKEKLKEDSKSCK